MNLLNQNKIMIWIVVMVLTSLIVFAKEPYTEDHPGFKNYEPDDSFFSGCEEGDDKEKGESGDIRSGGDCYGKDDTHCINRFKPGIAIVDEGSFICGQNTRHDGCVDKNTVKERYVYCNKPTYILGVAVGGCDKIETFNLKCNTAVSQNYICYPDGAAACVDADEKKEYCEVAGTVYKKVSYVDLDWKWDGELCCGDDENEYWPVYVALGGKAKCCIGDYDPGVVSIDALGQCSNDPDMDKDGVWNKFDLCPNSKGTEVDENGCEFYTGWAGNYEIIDDNVVGNKAAKVISQLSQPVSLSGENVLTFLAKSDRSDEIEIKVGDFSSKKKITDEWKKYTISFIASGDNILDFIGDNVLIDAVHLQEFPSMKKITYDCNVCGCETGVCQENGRCT